MFDWLRKDKPKKMSKRIEQFLSENALNNKLSASFCLKCGELHGRGHLCGGPYHNEERIEKIKFNRSGMLNS